MEGHQRGPGALRGDGRAYQAGEVVSIKYNTVLKRIDDRASVDLVISWVWMHTNPVLGKAEASIVPRGPAGSNNSISHKCRQISHACGTSSTGTIPPHVLDRRFPP